MSKSFFQTKRWKTIMNFIYGAGAAVVIVGALFKILHWPFANLMLIIGLLTEAGIFLISAFEPVHQDIDWSLVYPELAGGEPTAKPTSKGTSTGISAQLDVMLSEANVGPDLIQNLGSGLQSLSTNVKDMSTISAAAVATEAYSTSASAAAKNMDEISKNTAMVADSMSSFTGGLSSVLNNLQATESATGDFKGELDKLNKNLGNLNTIYGNMLSAMGGKG
jgi:hypothetical protein